jgi:hypothetical protein
VTNFRKPRPIRCTLTVLKYSLTLTSLVGLIAFASPDKSSITPTSITAIFTHLLNFLYREQSCIRDKVYGAVVRRAVVMVFASPSANFCTGSNSRHLSGLSHLDNLSRQETSRHLSGLCKNTCQP